jgi:hypothetical protein
MAYPQLRSETEASAFANSPEQGKCAFGRQPRITGELGFNDETRRICESESAVQLPQGINPDTPSVREEIVASRLPAEPSPGYRESAVFRKGRPYPQAHPPYWKRLEVEAQRLAVELRDLGFHEVGFERLSLGIVAMILRVQIEA